MLRLSAGLALALHLSTASWPPSARADAPEARVDPGFPAIGGPAPGTIRSFPMPGSSSPVTAPSFPAAPPGFEPNAPSRHRPTRCDAYGRCWRQTPAYRKPRHDYPDSWCALDDHCGSSSTPRPRWRDRHPRWEDY
jgi:hypothetical protein